MAWEWSHSPEAYAAVEENIQNMPREWLEVVFAEWRSAQEKHGKINTFHPYHNSHKYERALKYAKSPDMTDEALAIFIYEKASELRTCENGGFKAWACPFGCGCHLVPFSTPEEIAYEAQLAKEQSLDFDESELD